MAGTPAMMPVEEALGRVLGGARLTDVETVPLAQADGRTLAADLRATRAQPPVAVSQMDGYALRSSDATTAPARLRLIGAAAAGHGFAGAVGPGEAVRIFTGAPIPAGADAVEMQERAVAAEGYVTLEAPVPASRFVRPAGLDFREGEALLFAGARLGPADVALAAAMNHAAAPVRRRPRVVVLATGDELVEPGATPGPDQIVASNHLGVAAFVRAAGGEATILPITPDRPDALAASIRAALDARPDVLVTIGGASVGEFDLVRDALGAQGMELGFWKIAMRPGKPLIYGRIGDVATLGLPGNPVSSLVCARLFLVPLLRAMQGDPQAGADPTTPARLSVDLPANDERQDYLRAALRHAEDGALEAAPMRAQDSSVLRALAAADALLVRPPNAAPAQAGDACRVIRLR